MRALARLPVFLDLAGKRAIVAGGTAPAAWKAELAAAAGAAVEVYASAPGQEMAALLERGAASGTLTLVARRWCAADLAGAAIALADARDDAEARQFFEAARAAGVPVNVIDRPTFCQFQFGSIVNRSPVVVGISTDGGAPVLGQAIRRRIEMLLPASVAAWGRVAKDVRETVARRFPTAALRRAFWERFAERALAGAPGPDTPPPGTARQHLRHGLERLIDDIADSRPAVTGRVVLVGAGPGDAELLTIKALRALQSADVILYDDLVSDDVLELARREARRVRVGKRGSRESCAQSDINALMVQLAREGRRVVRLKSGDPMIFGRAGEEIAALEAAGIPVTVVPGITAASALAASLGASLTHRDCARSVRFVTGHSREGELPTDLDWPGLADPATTLVLYMAGRTAPAIAQRLMGHGLDPSTPVVAAAGIGRPDEWRWSGALSDLGARPLTGTRLPVLIGIGRAFACAATRHPRERPAAVRALRPSAPSAGLVLAPADARPA